MRFSSIIRQRVHVLLRPRLIDRDHTVLQLARVPFHPGLEVAPLQGVEIILVPNACNLKHDDVLGDARLAQIRARAFENMCCVAVTNYSQPNYDGHSCACNQAGKIVAMANELQPVAYYDNCESKEHLPFYKV